MSSLRGVFVVGCLTLSASALAQSASTPPSAAPTFQSDAVGVLSKVQEQMVSLEQAIPQAKFGWRPGQGVRSVAEVYLHAAGSAYFFAKQLGAEPPAEIQAVMKTFEKQTTDKAKIQKILSDSFAFLSKAIQQVPDAELQKTVSLGGQDLTKRALVLMGLGHYQEHLGQSIAYARVNGVVPPWSKGK
jgi:uncharacterized damage-inducible protein DinB